jgi:serine/threonine protein kinase
MKNVYFASSSTYITCGAYGCIYSPIPDVLPKETEVPKFMNVLKVGEVEDIDYEYLVYKKVKEADPDELFHPGLPVLTRLSPSCDFGLLRHYKNSLYKFNEVEEPWKKYKALCMRNAGYDFIYLSRKYPYKCLYLLPQVIMGVMQLNKNCVYHNDIRSCNILSSKRFDKINIIDYGISLCQGLVFARSFGKIEMKEMPDMWPLLYQINLDYFRHRKKYSVEEYVERFRKRFAEEIPKGNPRYFELTNCCNKLLEAKTPMHLVEKIVRKTDIYSLGVLLVKLAPRVLPAGWRWRLIEIGKMISREDIFEMHSLIDAYGFCMEFLRGFLPIVEKEDESLRFRVNEADNIFRRVFGRSIMYPRDCMRDIRRENGM